MEDLIWHNERRTVNDLLPYANNPRQMTERQVEQLTQSLKKFNLVDIPAIDLDNRIVSGHQRINVLKLLGRGQEEIDVRVPNRKLTEEEFREYLIRANKNTGEWAWEELANNFTIEELKDWGFEEQQLLGYVDKVEKIAEIDDTKVEEKVVTCPNCGHKL